MLRRENSSNNGFRVYSKEHERIGSKLEEKKRKIKENSVSPNVTRVEDATHMDAEKVKYSINHVTDDEEVPTGILDDESPIVEEMSEDEAPTGFLDEDISNTGSSSMPKLKVRKVSSIEENGGQRVSSERKNIRVNRSQSGSQDSPVRRSPSGRSITNSPKESHVTSNERRPRLAVSDASVVAEDDVPPIRKEDRDDKAPANRKSKSGKNGIPNVRNVILFVMLVILIVYIGYMLVSNVFETSQSGGDQGISVVSKSKIEEYLDSLYTDSTKSDIKEEVSIDNISEALNLVEEFKNSSSYTSEKYDAISGELSTISFFIQDRKIYIDLAKGVYEYGSDDYNDNLNTIKGDIEFYTVTGLAETMESRINILEASGGVGIGGDTTNTGNTVAETPSNSNNFSGSDQISSGTENTNLVGNTPVAEKSNTPSESGNVTVPETQGNIGDSQSMVEGDDSSQSEQGTSVIDDIMDSVN